MCRRSGWRKRNEMRVKIRSAAELWTVAAAVTPQLYTTQRERRRRRSVWWKGGGGALQKIST